MSSGFQQSQIHQLYPISNRRTPSAKTHINSLPSELLCHIFSCYCSLRYGPLPLLFVCRLWHAIASDCSALWGNIHYIPGEYYYKSTHEREVSEIEVRENPIVCDTLAKFQWAVTRPRTAPLNLCLGLFNTPGFHNQQVLDVLFFTRCRELSFLLLTSDTTVVAFHNNLPALEHLEFEQCGSAEVGQLFNDMERGSPLLWSLKLCGMWSVACLVHCSSLLRRIRCLDADFTRGECSDHFIMGLQNLTELTVRSRSSLQIPRGAFPKLLSLTIRNTELRVDEKVEFPVLDRLTLHEDWWSLPLIVAPRLTKLILRCKEGPNTPQTARLLQATVRPTSLVLSDASLAIDLPELLTMWSGLLELHLEYYEEVDVMSQVSLAKLGGNSDRGLLCPHLRYLTVHVNQGQRDPTVTGQIIQTLHTIVEERKRHDTDELRRVMCVWENWHTFNTGHLDKSKEIEWVDVL